MKKNVCVIGAGPSGLVATKELLTENHPPAPKCRAAASHSNPDLRTLVHYNRYMIGMAKLIGCSPWRPEILASPALAYRVWSGSQVPPAYRLYGPHSDHKTARRTILSLPSGFKFAQTALLTAAICGARLLTAVRLRKPDPVY